MDATRECSKPPQGWRCTREEGHYGPCAAFPINGERDWHATKLQAQLDKIIAELYERQREIFNWQPISTAPRDGTFVLLAGPSGYTSTPLRVEVCRFDEGYVVRGNDCFAWRDYGNNSFLDSGEAPTHWMPLPKI